MSHIVWGLSPGFQGTFPLSPLWAWFDEHPCPRQTRGQRGWELSQQSERTWFPSVPPAAPWPSKSQMEAEQHILAKNQHSEWVDILIQNGWMLTEKQIGFVTRNNSLCGGHEGQVLVQLRQGYPSMFNPWGYLTGNIPKPWNNSSLLSQMFLCARQISDDKTKPPLIEALVRSNICAWGFQHIQSFNSRSNLMRQEYLLHFTDT